MVYKSQTAKNKRRKKQKRHAKTKKDLRDTASGSDDKGIWEIPSDYSSRNSENFTSDYGSMLRYPASPEEEQLIHEEKNENLKK